MKKQYDSTVASFVFLWFLFLGKELKHEYGSGIYIQLKRGSNDCGN